MLTRNRRLKGIDHRIEELTTAAQVRAIKSIELLDELLSVHVRIGPKPSPSLFLTDHDYHRYFHLFARRVGLRSRYYLRKYSRCPAVVFSGQSRGFKISDSWCTIVLPATNQKSAKEKCLKMAEELGIHKSIHQLLEAARIFLQATKSGV